MFVPSTTVVQGGHECEEDHVHHAAARPSLNVVSRAGEAQQGLFNDLGGRDPTTLRPHAPVALRINHPTLS